MYLSSNVPIQALCWGGGLVDVVFSDSEVVCNRLLTGPIRHWTSNPVPHLFTGPRSLTVQPPANWVWKRHYFKHSNLGGSTTCHYALHLLFPSGLRRASLTEASLPKPPTLPPTPIEISVKSTESASPVTPEVVEAMAPSTTEPLIRPHRVKGMFSCRGLAPPDIARKMVVVPCVYNKPQFGARRLLNSELAGLWDVPISFIDQMDRRGPKGRQLLGQISKVHPTKVLVVGGDFLLSSLSGGVVGVLG